MLAELLNLLKEAAGQTGKHPGGPSGHNSHLAECDVEEEGYSMQPA